MVQNMQIYLHPVKNKSPVSYDFIIIGIFTSVNN